MNSHSSGETIPWWGAAVGGAVFIAVMLLLATVAVAGGWIDRADGGAVDLTGWLALEVVGGALAGLLAGAVALRVGRSPLAPLVLSAVVLTLGLVEAAELLRTIRGGSAWAPLWLVLVAPVVPTLAVAWTGRAGWPMATTLEGDGRWRGLFVTAAPFGLVGLLVALVLLGLPTVEPGPRTTLVASALALDLTVTVPAMVYILLVRTRRLPWIALLPAFAVGYAAARAVLPGADAPVLDALAWLVIPAELAVVTYLVVRGRQAFRKTPAAGDFVERFRSVARDALGTRVPADVLTTEVAVLRYALAWPGRDPQARPAGPGQTFSTHREAGYAAILFAVLLVIVTEAIALHLLVALWSPMAAWLLSGLSTYGAIWLLGDYRALAARPMRLAGDTLHVRLGIRWEADVPVAWIDGVERASSTDTGGFPVAVVGSPNVRLRLDREVELLGPYGLRRRSADLRLRVDDAATFIRLVGARLGHRVDRGRRDKP